MSGFEWLNEFENRPVSVYMRDEEEPWQLKKIEKVVVMPNGSFLIGQQEVEDVTMVVAFEDITCLAFFPQAEAEVHPIKGGSKK